MHRPITLTGRPVSLQDINDVIKVTCAATYGGVSEL